MTDEETPPEMGKVLDITARSRRGSRVITLPPARVFRRKGRRWKWYPAEEKAGLSVRHIAGGNRIILAFEDGGARPGVTEVVLDACERRFGPNDGSDPVELLESLIRRAVRWAREEAQEIRRSGGERTTLREAVGVGGAWKLTHGKLDMDEWWEVTGGGIDKTRVHRTIQDAERDFAGHKPPWRCGIHPVPGGREVVVDGATWRSGPSGRPCIRKAGHPDEHRDRDGVEWSTWPRPEARAVPLASTRNDPAARRQGEPRP